MKYIQQLDETDCGAACIAMIASHYNLNKSVTSIREIAGTDTKGTNLAGLIQGAQKLGFSAHALKGTKDGLVSDLPFPFIAHITIKHNEYTLLHYVIINSIHNNKIEIWDPDNNKKIYKTTIEDFCNIWTGYAVFMTPNNKIVLEKKESPFLLRFLPILKPYRKHLVLACLSSILLIFFSIISTIYTRYIIDEVIIAQAKNTLATLIIPREKHHQIQI